MFDESRRSGSCVDCSTIMPPTDTNYTLISSRYGWRLTRTYDALGNRVLEWRCPQCWTRYREQQKAAAPSTRRVVRYGT
jgi:hypothetical protein